MVAVAEAVTWVVVEAETAAAMGVAAAAREAAATPVVAVVVTDLVDWVEVAVVGMEETG